MAKIIEFNANAEPRPRMYHIDVTQLPDDLYFTINGVKVDSASLYQVADELERIVHIIRSDVMSGVVKS